MKKYLLPAACMLLSACSGPTSPEAALTGGNTTEAANPEAVDTKVSDGPFGYSMGQSIDGLKLEKMEKPGLYQTSSPPKPHADFETVVLEAYPGVGICQIRGIGKNIEGDGDGSQIRSRVDELAETLATKYGPGKKVDRCSGGDVACDSQFWMMTMINGERFYGYGWDHPNQAMKSANIDSIYAVGNAANISASFSIVEYQSSKTKECDTARKKISASSL